MLRKIIYTLVGAIVLGLLAWSLILSQSADLDNANIIAIVIAAVGGVLGYWLGSRVTANFGSGETLTSLKIFFILSGLLGIRAIFNSGNPDSEAINISFNSINGVIAIINAILGLINIYIGFNLKNLLKNHLSSILKLMYAELIIGVLGIIPLMWVTEINTTSIILMSLVGIGFSLRIISELKRIGMQSQG
jgi:hypothetical protein